jgi:hypothetical protein
MIKKYLLCVVDTNYHLERAELDLLTPPPPLHILFFGLMAACHFFAFFSYSVQVQ